MALKGFAKFDDILMVGYFLNGTSILDVKLANLVPLWPTYTRDDWWTPFLFWIFKVYVMMIAYKKFNGFLTLGYFFNGRHRNLVEYRTMPLGL